MACNSARLPLLLERDGERRIKSTRYPPHPNLLDNFSCIVLPPASMQSSLKGEGEGTCVDTSALKERELIEILSQSPAKTACTFCTIQYGFYAI